MKTTDRFVLLGIVAVVLPVFLGFKQGSWGARTIARMHYAMAVVFIGLVVLGVYFQYWRVKMRDRIDWVVWMHLVLFAVLVYLSTSAVVYHYRKMKMMYGSTKSSSRLSSGGERLITTFKGDKYDLTDFAKSHPGGAVIWQANGKDLEQVWNDTGNGWHLKNETVMNVLKRHKI